VDTITWGADGRITEFKVMIRPEDWEKIGVKSLILTFAINEPRKPLLVKNFWIPDQVGNDRK